MNVTKSSNDARWHGWANDVRRIFEHLLSVELIGSNVFRPIKISVVSFFMNVTKSSNNVRWYRWTNDARRMFEHLLIASKCSRRIWTETSKSVWQAGRLVCGSKHVEASMCD